jgi:hypothetical protein
MWYGADDGSGTSRTGYAYSWDGIQWRKYDGNPVLMEGAAGAFDALKAGSPCVIKDGNAYKLWYAGFGTASSGIGYATSSAYQGTDFNIDRASVKSVKTADGMEIQVSCAIAGPGTLDINEIIVTGPGGFSMTLPDGYVQDILGNGFYLRREPVDPVASGSYTFTAKTNNGLVRSVSRDLSFATIPVPEDGALGLERKVNGKSDKAYVGTAALTFQWKPALGDNYFYRLRIHDWRGRVVWYLSSYLKGDHVDGNGYLTVTVPSSDLKPQAPFTWEIEVSESDNQWESFNVALSTLYGFYTGAKDTSSPYEFINFVGFMSERSFHRGTRAAFWSGVRNLAPWDIDESAFVVRDPTGGIFYTFSPDDDAQTSVPLPFMYVGAMEGIPSPGDYLFTVQEKGTAHKKDFPRQNFADVPDLPMVLRQDMQPADNAYILGTEPTLSWVSAGSQYQQRVMVTDWNWRRTSYSSAYFTNKAAGEILSVTIPKGTLKAFTPYRWWVEIWDSNNNSRTRSPFLAFTTGGHTIQGKVSDEAPLVSGAAVLYDDWGEFVASADLGPEGSFSLSRVRDGTYRIAATAQGYPCPVWTDPFSVSGGDVTVPDIRIGLCGDMDGDGDVDGKDLAAFASGFGKVLGEVGYDMACDLNGTDAADADDLGILAGAFGGAL